MEETVKILLCEDDENLGMLLREYLQTKGFAEMLDTCKRSHATVTMGAAHPTCIPCSKSVKKRSPPPREDCAHLLNPGEVHDGPPRRTHSIGDLTQRKKQASLPELL